MAKETIKGETMMDTYKKLIQQFPKFAVIPEKDDAFISVTDDAIISVSWQVKEMISVRIQISPMGTKSEEEFEGIPISFITPEQKIILSNLNKEGKCKITLPLNVYYPRPWKIKIINYSELLGVLGLKNTLKPRETLSYLMIKPTYEYDDLTKKRYFVKIKTTLIPLRLSELKSLKSSIKDPDIEFIELKPGQPLWEI